jgi:hypothetical protein
MLVAPSEAVDKAFISRHFIPVSVIIIPIVIKALGKMRSIHEVVALGVLFE